MKNLLSTLVITSALVSSAAFASEGKQDWSGMKTDSTPSVATTPLSSDNGIYIVGGFDYSITHRTSTHEAVLPNTAPQGSGANGQATQGWFDWAKSFLVSNTTAPKSIPFIFKAKPKSGIGFTAGLGMNFSENARVDAIISYKPSIDVDVKIKHNGIIAEPNFKLDLCYRQLSFMLNGYYDFFEVLKDIKAYGTIGIGVTNIKGKSFYGHHVTTNLFTWQAGVGLTGKMSEKIMWDLGYRYNHPKSVHIGPVRANTQSHNVLGSLRVYL